MPKSSAHDATRAGLVGYLALFASLYAGYGALSPFLPAFLQQRGLSPEEISWFLASAMLVRLVAGPLAGRLADRTGATRGLLALSLVLAAGLCAAFLAGSRFVTLLAIGLMQAAATAPLAPLADALALSAARSGQAFEYGWVRAGGSAAFIAATALTGQLVGIFGHDAGLLASAAAFGAAALVALRVRVAPANELAAERRQGFRELLAIARFRRLVLASGLVIGAHAMHDAFAIIVWTGTGVSAGAAGLLWSEAVAAEIAVFLGLGPWLLARIGAPRALALAASAGAVRWTVQAQTSWVPALIGIQCLHGLTFALLYLASLALIEESVPDRLRATALAVYGNVGLGLASAVATFAAGSLYARFGAQAFLAMSALSVTAIPLALCVGSRREAKAPI